MEIGGRAQDGHGAELLIIDEEMQDLTNDRVDCALFKTRLLTARVRTRGRLCSPCHPE